MMDVRSWPLRTKLGATAGAAALLVGIFFRLYAIRQPNFFLFDEGFYLQFNYAFVYKVATHMPSTFGKFCEAFYSLVRFSMETGKPLWFILADMRAFWGGAQDWAYPRLVAAVAGIVTVALTYRFAWRFYQSRAIALLSAAVLAVLPSHVFYSRLALQETVSGLCFLLGFYFYLFPRRFGNRTFLSAVFFGAAYFSNYRLIIAPCLVFLTEAFECLLCKEKNRIAISFQKYLWHFLTFLSMVFVIGGMDRGQHIQTVYAWMFFQTNLAETHRDWFGFLSYPYYFFALESIVFGLLFFANVYFVVRRQWQRSFPFLLVLVLMAVFSLTGDRGARYMCVGLPFAAMAVASFIVEVSKNEKWKIPPLVTAAVIAALLVSLLPKAWMLAAAKSDYRTSAALLRRVDPGGKILSTQPWTHKLFVRRDTDVMPAPYGYKRFLSWYSHGYRYVLIDPQAYISCTASGNKFDLKLKGFLGFVDSKMRPVKVFPHFNSAVLERVVFEHNENLLRSLAFLMQDRRRLGSLRVYDMTQFMDKAAERSAILYPRDREAATEMPTGRTP